MASRRKLHYAWIVAAVTFLTLLVVPAVYTIVDDAQRLASGLPGRIRRLNQRWVRSGRHGSIVPVPVAGATD